MKMSKFILAAAILIFSAQFAMAQDAEAIMKQSHLNYYYSGDDGKADVVMTLVDGSGKERVKEFTMVRKDLVDGGEQLYFVYFKKPSDIRRMTFMVSKHVDSDDDRMLYVPAIDLVKKIAASDKASSFVGSDFSYEDVSGRLWTVDNHELMGEDKIGDTPVYKIKSTPKADDYFAYRISFIDKEQKLPLREEFYDKQGKLERVFTAEKIETVDGIPTITVRKMENVAKGQYTTIDFGTIKYNIGIDEKYFSERYMKKPHVSLR